MYTTTPHAAKLLVGNKIDLEREVSVEEATSFARKQAMMYIEASARTREGIRQSFEEVVQKILDTPALLNEGSASSSALEPGADDPGDAAGGCQNLC